MNEPRDKKGLTEAEFLAAYDPSKWERPSVTVDMFCYCRENRSLLMVKRGGHPFEIQRVGKPGLKLPFDKRNGFLRIVDVQCRTVPCRRYGMLHEKTPLL